MRKFLAIVAILAMLVTVPVAARPMDEGLTSWFAWADQLWESIVTPFVNFWEEGRGTIGGGGLVELPDDGRATRGGNGLIAITASDDGRGTIGGGG